MAGEEEVYGDFEDDDTLSMDFQYAEVVVQYGRVYQRYALEENLYYVPADPVCLTTSNIRTEAWTSYTQDSSNLPPPSSVANRPLQDEDERLTIQHHVVTRFLDGNLIHAPIQADPKNVLDCGYGQADWALSVAARYPDCEVGAMNVLSDEETGIVARC